MSCERYEDGLIEHALGAPPSADVAAHLASCAACRARLEAERGLAADIDGMLATALRVEPRNGFEERVRRHVQEANRRAPLPVRWIALGAGLAAAVTIVLLVRPRPDDRGGSVATVAPTMRATEAPAATPTSTPPHEAAPARTRQSAAIPSHQTAHADVEPEVLVVPEDAAALRRLGERLQRPGPERVWLDPQEERPRIRVVEVPLYDAQPLTSLTTGGGV